MGDKKGKALALELIDDLLNDKSEIVELKDERQKKTPLVQGTVVQAQAPPIKNQKTPAPNDKTEVSVDKPMPVLRVPASELSNPSQPSVPKSPSPALSPADDRTVPLKNDNAQTVVPGHPNQNAEDRARTSVGRPGAFRSLGAPTATEAALAQSESLRIAQSRILDLEQEIERLRVQNEKLGAAGETLRRRADELLTENSQRESDYSHAVSTFEQEKNILAGTKEALQRELEQLKRKGEEDELRISNSVQKIRVRERELENRLELVKMESAALIRSKDEMILDLKRQIDQLNMELNNYRLKNQELNRTSNDKQEQLRRTVKALRLALSMLEGEEEAPKVRKIK